MHYHDVSSEDRDELERSIRGLSDFIPETDLDHVLSLWQSSAWTLEELWDELYYFAVGQEAKTAVSLLEQELDL